jgi:hypothetical protein
MRAFLLNNELWADIIGAIATSAATGLAIYFVRKRRKRKILMELTELMGQAIQHRKIGEDHTYADKMAWARQAIVIRTEAINKAKQLSPSSDWTSEEMDEQQSWNGDDEVEKYVSILTDTIERIGELVKKNP